MSVHLHCHSDFSTLDGLQTPKEIVARAVELGQSAVAITDHGSVAGHIELLDAAHEAGIKPILGMEAYQEHHIESRDQRKNARKHLTLYAMNNEGLANLWSLSTKGYVDGFYSKPRVDWSMLEAHSTGLVAGSACLGGFLSQAALREDEAYATYILNRYREIFDGRFFIEIHTFSSEEQKKVNIWLVDFARKNGVPISFACDSHYTYQSDYDYHEALIGIQTRKKFSDDDRWTWLPDFYMMDDTQIRKALSYLGDDVVDLCLEGSDAVAELISDDIVLDTTIKFPDIEPPTWFVGTNNEYVLHLCQTCFFSKLMGYDVVGVENGRLKLSDAPTKAAKEIDFDRYSSRLKYELDFIMHYGLTQYFMVVSDYTMAAKKMMLVGPARGSAAGSLVCYLMGITEIDPLKYDLPFERFLNSGRFSEEDGKKWELPDVDLDFPTEKRHLVKEYLEDKYGADKVSSIGTIGRFGAKQAIKDAAFYHGVPFKEANDITAIFDDIPTVEGLSTWDDFIDAVPDQKQVAELRKREKLFATASHLFGVARSAGGHAAGVIISPVSLEAWLPLRTRKGEATTQFDMHSVDRLGFPKVDLLGLRTLGTLEEALSLIEQRYGIKLNLYRMTDEQLADARRWAMLGSGKVLGCFQAECLAEGTLVQGVPIEEHYKKPPKTLHSVDLDTMEIVENEVVAVYDCGEKDIYEVCVGSRKIRCGEEHPFFTENRGWVKVKDLTTDDVVYWDTQEATDKRRSLGAYDRTPERRRKISEGMKKAHAEGRGGKGATLWKEKGFPNPRKGKKSGPSVLKNYSERQKALWRDPEYRERQTKALNKVLKSEEWRESCRGREPRGNGRSKAGFRPDLGRSFRSTWEANYARVLLYTGVEYEYEPKRYVYQVNGVKTGYTPDFILEDGTHVEVKGWWWPGYKERFDEFIKQHPEITVLLIEKAQYLELKATYKPLIPTWEDDCVAG